LANFFGPAAAAAAAAASMFGGPNGVPPNQQHPSNNPLPMGGLNPYMAAAAAAEWRLAAKALQHNYSKLLLQATGTNPGILPAVQQQPAVPVFPQPITSHQEGCDAKHPHEQWKSMAASLTAAMSTANSAIKDENRSNCSSPSSAMSHQSFGGSINSGRGSSHHFATSPTSNSSSRDQSGESNKDISLNLCSSWTLVEGGTTSD